MWRSRIGLAASIFLVVVIDGFPAVSKSEQPPTVLPQKKVLRFSPYYSIDQSSGGSGEQWVDNIEQYHKPISSIKYVDGQCSVNTIRDILSLGEYALIYFSSHGALYQAAGNKELLLIRMAHYRPTIGTFLPDLLRREK